MQKPEKPKNYVRDNIVIVLLGLLVFAGLHWFGFSFFAVLVPIWVGIILSNYWFRDYNAKLLQYQQFVREEKRKADLAKCSEHASNVNENIARYICQQRQKRAQAKWWQFWV